MRKDLKAGPRNAAFEEARLAAKAFPRGTEVITAMMQIATAPIPPLDAVEPVPDALVGIQIRGRRRQTLPVEALRRTVREELFGGGVNLKRSGVGYSIVAPSWLPSPSVADAYCDATMAGQGRRYPRSNP